MESFQEFRQEEEMSSGDSSCDSSSFSSESSSYSLDDRLINDEDNDDIDQDKMARQMMKMMKKHAESVSKILVERAALIDSICWLGQHVPRCVLEDLFQDIYLISSDRKLERKRRKSIPNDQKRKNIPHGQNGNNNSEEMHARNSSRNQNLDDTLDVKPRGLSDYGGKQQTKSYIDPFADESDSDSTIIEKDISPPLVTGSGSGYLDPFPYNSDEDKVRGQTKHENKTREDNKINGDNNNVDEKDITSSSCQQDPTLKFQPPNRTSPMVLPYASYHNCALLFVDISGFTKLSQILDVENLSKTINNYFEMIVSEVIRYGGDVLKFAGDAIFAEWPVIDTSSRPSNNISLGTYETSNLEQCAATAALCATSIVKLCNDYPVIVSSGVTREAGISNTVGTLNVHCGVGVGCVAAIHVGDDTYRRELLLVGDPIEQVAEAESLAALGEVAVSPIAFNVLSSAFDFHTTVSPTISKPIVIASRSESYFVIKQGFHLPLELDYVKAVNELKGEVSMMCEPLDFEDLQKLRLMISLYVHPVVAKDELSTKLSLRADSSGVERHQAEAELRDVYTIFIMPLITAKLTGNSDEDHEMFCLLNKILLIVNRELQNYRGHLRQFIVDDKGVVLIANFGLRGSTFPNMISGHGLPCALEIHNALQAELDVDNQMGATFGAAYCGVVGGIRRHEFAVLGPSVNLSARLMCYAQNPGILVDSRVRLKATKDYSFNALMPVKAKGYADPVPIFEPLSAAAKRWGKAIEDFVGRTSEVDSIVRFVNECAYTGKESKMLLIQAESGTGKSALMLQAISKVKNICKKRLIITRNISNQGHRMIPFSMFRAVFKDVLGGFDGVNNVSNPSGTTASSQNSSDKSASEMSTSHHSTATAVLEKFSHLVDELNAPPEFVELVGHHILGLRGQSDNNAVKGAKASSLEMIVDFIARAFRLCTSYADLVLLVLDDVQWLDELSWKVIQALFKEGQRLLILCSTRPLKSYSLGIDPVFWDELHNYYARELRFSTMTLVGLDEDNIRALISKKLGVQKSSIDRDFFVDIHARSGGMPHFASQMLETIKRSDLVTRLDNGKLGWRKDMCKKQVDFNFSTVGELLVYRIDFLDSSVRKILHLCAVLGMEFTLREVVASYHNLSPFDDSEKEIRETNVFLSLKVAVDEGIIDQIFEGGIPDKDEDEEEETADEFTESVSLLVKDENAQNDRKEKPFETNISFRFHHAMWQEAILKLLLDSRKRILHQVIAETLEKESQETSGNNYYSLIKLFEHWKASGNALKASSIALTVGKSFANIGLGTESVKILDDALDVWRSSFDSEREAELCSGFSLKFIQSLSVDGLKSILQLLVDKGKCLSTLHTPKESVKVYDAALAIIEKCPASGQMKDRSISFTLFSGLFVLLKFGMIEQDKECTYEQDIVRRFVEETKFHGDPVHYSRALAMQAETFARLGKVSMALKHFDQLSKTYDVEKHSDAVCKSYGSDRCAQVFSLSVLWNLHIGNEEKASELCEFCLRELLPKMNIRNVHNSMVFLWPLYNYLKERGEAKRMRDILEEFVFQPFQDYYGKNGFTFCLPLYKPAGMLLELCDDASSSDIADKVNWALEECSGVFSDMFDNAMGNYGSTCTQVTCEICLCLAKRVADPDLRRELIVKGIILGRFTNNLCIEKEGTIKMPYTLGRNQRILQDLEAMALEFGVTEEMIKLKNIKKPSS